MSKFPPQEPKGITAREVVDDTLQRYPKLMAELKRQEDKDRAALREGEKK